VAAIYKKPPTLEVFFVRRGKTSLNGPAENSGWYRTTPFIR
jgi:hypothetical protein